MKMEMCRPKFGKEFEKKNISRENMKILPVNR